VTEHLDLIIDVVERTWARHYRKWPLLEKEDAKQQAMITCLQRASTWNGNLSSAPTFFSLVARHAMHNAHKVELTHRKKHPVSSNETNDVGQEMIHEIPEFNDRESHLKNDIVESVRCIINSLPPLVRNLLASQEDLSDRNKVLEAAGITRQAGDKRVKKAIDSVKRHLRPLI